ncbi:MAG: 16S rRNA (uracil(1498)-N(3))-methyltransferase [Spirochaetaceae bacterium]|jgi:RsmE family RNA methyltransferase|nr:16S rRNA (uracil(1498)-N(3))-methyltransferase [Spirochaetaceae bacterium]
MNIVLFDEPEISVPLPLSDPRAQHIVTVLRKRAGDTFEAGVVNRAAGVARIGAVTDAITFEFTPQTEGLPLYPLHMLVGFPRPIQLRRLFRDMAGLGVQEIHLAGTDLGEKSYRDSTLFERGRAEALLREGSAQARSVHVPRLFRHESLEAALEAAGPATGGRFALDVPSRSPRFATAPLAEVLASEGPRPPVWAAVGSERGWTDRERELLLGAGFRLCGLGERVLRTETACTAAAALILSIMTAPKNAEV